MTPQQAAAILGRNGGLKGGKSRSIAKQAAARRNGRKGGRKPLEKARAKVRKNLGRRGIGPAGDPLAASDVVAHETPRRPKITTKARPAKQGDNQ